MRVGLEPALFAIMVDVMPSWRKTNDQYFCQNH
jgi:hypothetical protein